MGAHWGRVPRRGSLETQLIPQVDLSRISSRPLRRVRKKTRRSINIYQHNWVVVLFFYFDPYLGKWSILTNIFRVETTDHINVEFHHVSMYFLLEKVDFQVDMLVKTRG